MRGWVRMTLPKAGAGLATTMSEPAGSSGYLASRPEMGGHRCRQRVIAKKNEMLPATTNRCQMGLLNGNRCQP